MADQLADTGTYANSEIEQFDDATQPLAQVLVAFFTQILTKRGLEMPPMLLNRLPRKVSLLGKARAGLHFRPDRKPQQHPAVLEPAQDRIEIFGVEPGELGKRCKGRAASIGQPKQHRIVARFQTARQQRGKQSLPGEVARFDQAGERRRGWAFRHV